MTTVYFVRHAQPNYENHDDMTRELTEKGQADSKKVTEFFRDKGITAVYSSPFRRAVDTVKHFARSAGLPIELVGGFRERKISNDWIDPAVFQGFSHRQWADWDYRLPTGESLNQAQTRCLVAFNSLLAAHPGENLVISTHGTALSVMLAHYDPGFDERCYQALLPKMPLIVQCDFEGDQCIQIQQFTV